MPKKTRGYDADGAGKWFEGEQLPSGYSRHNPQKGPVPNRVVTNVADDFSYEEAMKCETKADLKSYAASFGYDLDDGKSRKDMMEQLSRQVEGEQ
jgi:hypothetical protein